MNKYEAMVIIRPDLSEEDKKSLLSAISEAVAKNNGQVSEAKVWADKRKLCFPIKRQREGIYYLVSFSSPPEAIDKIKYAFKLNEQITRVMISRIN